MLSRGGHARKVFDIVPAPDTVLWNTLLAGLSGSEALESFVRMVSSESVRPDAITLASVLPAASEVADVTMGKCVHVVAEKGGLAEHEHVLTGLISLYTKLNYMESARKAFDVMPEKTMESWNAMISGYAQNGLTEMAIALLSLSKCWIITEEDLEPNGYVMTVLIDMYTECGSISEARSIFKNINNKNVVSWNAMITGYGFHGQGAEALQLYKDMLDANLLPTSATFLLVLHAATEAGQLKEAFELISEFPKSATGPGVWGALLGACMVHKDSDLAKLASQKLFELNPENSGYYVLLSNLHTSKKQYSEAAVVRQEAKRRQLVKTSGYTLVKIGEKPHVFMAGDRAHPQSEAICLYLEKLTSKMIEAGYRPEIEAALYGVEEEEKEHMVKVHSEKLAIAFGLLSTEPGTEIRIIKNLRVCLDCHNATKFISKVVWLKEFQVSEDKTCAINLETGVSNQLSEIIKKWLRSGQTLAVGNVEYKTTIEARLGIYYLCSDAVMEVMWGLKNLMKSLVSDEKSDLTNEDRLQMCQGMKIVLDRHGIDATRDELDDLKLATALKLVRYPEDKSRSAVLQR
ncbi:hypothetical protein E2562_036287 [Oryza meyeriana var. granulata]|uniref:DYW domain-containing protein n=1 Tax=Oryza meyeriana var. granulata TaxID=110450 RepID=A0A6G1DSG4_9ORYZ|nr:hypothetical protein E2562_036287 [Oryza meyeriana var. granulata]